MVRHRPRLRAGLRNSAFVLLFISGLLMTCSAQDPGTAQSEKQVPESTGPVASAIETGENAGSDTPPRGFGQGGSPEAPSFLVAGAAVSESAEDLPNRVAGNSNQLYSVTRVSGTIDLIKFWHRSVTVLDYLGGGIFASSYSQQIQQLTAGERFLWRTRQLTLTNSFGTFPAGTFGASAFGGSALYDAIFAGTGVSFQTTPDLYLLSGANTFGRVGQGTHLTNVSIGEFTQTLSTRSAVIFAGSYGFSDYANAQNLINSRQIAALANYIYQLSPKSGIGVLYAYQDFRYPESSEGRLTANQVLFVYQRQPSHRMSFSVSAGPEFATLHQRIQVPFIEPPFFINLKTNQINLSASGSLRYALERGSIALAYHRLVGNGSGFAAGANTDIVQAAANRNLARRWSGSLDFGYVRLRQIGQSSTGVPPGKLDYWYTSASVRRTLTAHFSAFAGYEFTDEQFAGSFCASGRCSGPWNIFTLGLSWRSHPIRLGGEAREGQPAAPIVSSDGFHFNNPLPPPE